MRTFIATMQEIDIKPIGNLDSLGISLLKTQEIEVKPMDDLEGLGISLLKQKEGRGTVSHKIEASSVSLTIDVLIFSMLNNF